MLFFTLSILQLESYNEGISEKGKVVCERNTPELIPMAERGFLLKRKLKGESKNISLHAARAQ